MTVSSISSQSTPSLPLLHLMHLASPALPVGGYAYSQGLEFAIDSGLLKDRDAVADWLQGVLLNGLALLEMPIILRVYDALNASGDAELNYWNNYLQACRETGELLLEDTQQGEALARLINGLTLVELAPAKERLATVEGTPSFAIAFALAAFSFNANAEGCLQAFAYSWLENQVAAATKLVPLGQTAAQQLLLELLPLVDSAIAAAKRCSTDAIGVSLPGQVMASSLHEYQYSRLFRS